MFNQKNILIINQGQGVYSTPFFVFLKNPGFQKDRPFHQKPGFLRAQKYLLVSAKTWGLYMAEGNELTQGEWDDLLKYV